MLEPTVHQAQEHPHVWMINHSSVVLQPRNFYALECLELLRLRAAEVCEAVQQCNCMPDRCAMRCAGDHGTPS
jgi:hypothetical protein